MPKFVIERDIPGVGDSPAEALKGRDIYPSTLFFLCGLGDLCMNLLIPEEDFTQKLAKTAEKTWS